MCDAFATVTRVKPVLIVCAHGTDDPDGRATTLAIAAAARERLGVDVRDAYVDVQAPYVGEVTDEIVAAGGTAVIVPLLLSPGYHLEVDVDAAVSRHPGAVVSSGPLGPHDGLVDVLLARVREAGGGEDLSLVVGVAGSSRPEARAKAEDLVLAVQARWRGPVSVGFLAAAEPRVGDAVATARAASGSQVAVASYLVGRGFFQRRLEASGADVVAQPLGAHPRLVDVVVERYRAAAGGCR